MSKSYKFPIAISPSGSESASSEEESSSGEDDVYNVRDQSGNDGVNGKERVDSLYKRTLIIAGKGRNDYSERDFVRQIPGPMGLTTAQQRTRMAMFGITNTELTQTDFTHPVLYVALYDTGDAPHEVDDYHWAFIVGPSHEEADSKGTLYNMEPRQTIEYDRSFVSEWRWLYNQPSVPLRGQYNLLARLMIAEVTDMSMLQETMLRWGEGISMREHVEWMSVKWIKNVLKNLEGERGCLGRRMESFESVEVEGRWLAETEKEKRKGFCLLDTRVSTRILFQRERQTALSSTATVDIAIKYPILYVAVYKNHLFPYQNDEYHWAFLIGPSKETAESEGVFCGVESQFDTNGMQMWGYNQTIVPLCGQDDILVRMLVAEIVDLRPLGEILRDQDVTPTTERTDCILGDSKWNSLAWVRGKLEILERKPECFAYKCNDLSLCERIGMKFAIRRNEQQKEAGSPHIQQDVTICLVSGWTEPDDDETKVLVKLDLARGNPNTISRAVQIATGVLGAAALKMRQQVFEREKQELVDKEEAEANARSETNGNTTVGCGQTKLQDVDNVKEIATITGGQEATTRLESFRVASVSFAKLNKPDRASKEEMIAKEDEEDGEESVDDDDDAEDDDKDGDQEDEDDSDEDDEDDNKENSDKGEAKGIAVENVREKILNIGPEDVRYNSVHPVVSKKAVREKNLAKENKKLEDATENEEDEDEDKKGDDTDDSDNADDSNDDDQDENSDEDSDEEDDDQDDGDLAKDSDEDEGDEGDEEEDKDGEVDEGEDKDEEYSGLKTAVTSNSTIKLSR